MKTSLKFLIPIMALTMVACAKKEDSASLMSPPVRYERVGQDAKANEKAETPKIEILFVIDNSKSMDKHIKNLSDNIDQFVSALGTNLPFPYHVGVTTTYDSRGALSSKKIEPGQLVEVKNEAGEVIPNKYFISSQDEKASELLRQTLKVGTLALADGGPEVEELFTPVSALYGFGKLAPSAAVKSRQAGFFMGPNAHKVVFFITDASDNSTMTESELFVGLQSAANGDSDKILSYGAVVKAAGGAGCAIDPGMRNNKVPKFLNLVRRDKMQSNILDLCSNNFGRRLATVGAEIRTETITRMIRLANKPDFTVNPNSINFEKKEGIWVTYGTESETLKRQRLPMELAPNQVGYAYDKDLNAITINPNFKFDTKPGAYLRIEYIPILDSSIQQGRVKPWVRQ